MKILFTKSNKLGSHLIRLVTGEDVSHCAVLIFDGTEVLHSTHSGVNVIPYSEFEQHNDILRVIDIGPIMSETMDESMSEAAIVDKYIGKPYDYMAFIYLGLRFILRIIGISIPKANLFNVSGMFLCTELVGEVAGVKGNLMLTPGQLYDILSKRQKRK